MTNSHGQVCDGRNGTFFCSSSLVAEAKAFLEGISLGSSRQVTTSVLTDSLTLINVLNNALYPRPWECSTYINSMLQILERCPWIDVGYTPRSINYKADWVAKETRKHSLPEDWLLVLNEPS
ncbi:hypothetical protein LINPERHAP2_LOCUS27655 [Linum perenne]